MTTTKRKSRKKFVFPKKLSGILAIAIEDAEWVMQHRPDVVWEMGSWVQKLIGTKNKTCAVCQAGACLLRRFKANTDVYLSDEIQLLYGDKVIKACSAIDYARRGRILEAVQKLGFFPLDEKAIAINKISRDMTNERDGRSPKRNIAYFKRLIPFLKKHGY